MFEKAPNAAEQATPQVHELRVAVFDLSQNALASASFAIPTLVNDRQQLNDNGMPGVSGESRAIHVGSRNLLGLPPIDILGRVHADESDVSGYAVATRSPIDFRSFTVRRYELGDVVALAHKEANLGHETGMDYADAELILACLSLREVRQQVPRRYRLS